MLVDNSKGYIPSQLLEIDRFGGINLAQTPSQIGDNEATEILNFVISEAGKLKKRTGFRLVKALGAGKVNGFTIFRDSLYIHHKDKLYKLNNDETISGVYTGLNDHKTTFFNMNNKLYILDGLKYFVYDGLTVIEVKNIAYAPTLFIASEPVFGSGQEFEQWNLLSSRFRQRYSPTGTDTKYQLCLTNLDTGAVKVSLDGGYTWKSEGDGFTVDRVKGQITFSVAPLKATDNLLIEASKAITSNFIDRIGKCTLYSLYGGTNDTRVILSGNSEAKSVMFRSGVYDPTYFPENYYQSVGSTEEAITGFAIQYDYCIVFKEHSIWHIRYELVNNTTPTYSVRPLNDTVGCINPSSIQLVENAPFFLDRRGIYTITQSNVREEKNVELVSEKINYTNFVGQNGLMQEPNLKEAISIDYDSKYMLCLNGKVYIFDYRSNAWYKWDNIRASALIEYNNKLYFGDTEGNICVFKEVDEMKAYDDIETPIKTIWKSKIFDFGHDEKYKLIEKVYMAMNTASRTSAYLSYITEDNKVIFADRFILDLFNYATFDYSRFTYYATPFPVENTKKLKVKKAVYFQIIIENLDSNESLEVLSMDLRYRVQGYIK